MNVPKPTAPSAHLPPSARSVTRPAAADSAPRMSPDGLALSRTAHGPVPYIHQMHPQGAEGGYHNGFANCAPTSMAMVARAFGYGSDLTDAQLINHLGDQGGTTSKGSSPATVVAMAKLIGKPAVVTGPRPDPAGIAAQLAQGKLVVAHGNYYAMPPHEQETRTFAGGHFIAIVGTTPEGHFRIHDPLDPKKTEATPAELEQFFKGHPSGGHAIVVG